MAMEGEVPLPPAALIDDGVNSAVPPKIVQPCSCWLAVVHPAGKWSCGSLVQGLRKPGCCWVLSH